MAATASRVQIKLFEESYRTSLKAEDLEADDIPKEDSHNFWCLLRVSYNEPDGIWPKVFRDEFALSVNLEEGDKNRRPLEVIPLLLIKLGMIAYPVALWLCYCGVE